MSAVIKTEAKIVDSMFVVSFTGEAAGKIWRQPLAALGSSAMEIREAKGALMLVARLANGQEEEVFSFADRASAVEALRTITQALFQSSDARPVAPVKQSFGRRLFKGVVYLLAVVACLIIMTILFHSIPSSQESKPSSAQTSMPVPADELLK